MKLKEYKKWYGWLLRRYADDRHELTLDALTGEEPTIICDMSFIMRGPVMERGLYVWDVLRRCM